MDLVNIQLLNAALDLSLVRLIRGAMRTADIYAASHPGVGPLCDRKEVLKPEPRYLPRDVFHPAPRIEDRPVIYSSPTVQTELKSETVVDSHPIKSNSIPPVWKSLPPIEPEPKVQVKIVVRKVDIENTGTLIDLFM